jgi:hypothetical protein
MQCVFSGHLRLKKVEKIFGGHFSAKILKKSFMAIFGVTLNKFGVTIFM